MVSQRRHCRMVISMWGFEGGIGVFQTGKRGNWVAGAACAKA